MLQNTGQQNQLTDSRVQKPSTENADSCVGCLDITFPDKEGKQFSIKISSFCALSLTIVSVSRNPQSNLQSVFSECHSKKSLNNILNFSPLQKYEAVLALLEIEVYNNWFYMHMQVLQVYVQIAYM